MPGNNLIRGLGGLDAASLVVGTVIGTGIFLKSSTMLQQAGTPWLVLWVWIAAGLLSLAGALTYSELGAMMPEAGGEFVYLRAAFGDLPAFLFGWMRLVVGAGSLAAIAVGFATFSESVLPLSAVWLRSDIHLFGRSFEWQFGTRQITAASAAGFLCLVNCMGVVAAGKFSRC